MKNKKRVLIVDDEESITETMAEILSTKGLDIVTANNGVTGLKILTEQAIDLVILDLNMPRMDGYMFMEHLKQRWENDGRRFPFPKVLVMTAVDKKTDLGLAHNLGATEFMNKPFKNDEFTAVVKKLVS